MNLLNTLINDEKKENKKLYSSGPYWDYKNKKTILEIKKKGLSEFRGFSTGIGTSFTDNIVFDIRNELNLRGRIVSKIFSFPLINRLYKSQLDNTKNYIDLYLKNLAIVYKNNSEVIKLIEKYKFENTTEFGCVRKFEYLNKEYSVHYLKMADRVNNLSEVFDFNNIRSYFEIGGGFGANIHFLITNYPNIKKIVYLDVVPNILVGTEYLRFHYKNKVKDYLLTRDFKEIYFEDNDELEIICIPPWEIEKINTRFDHFHNAASFVEMPKKIVKNYVKYIKKFKIKDISLISYDKFDLSTTFNPENLQELFDIKLNIFWKKDLIEDYNKKLIYLTSN